MNILVNCHFPPTHYMGCHGAYSIGLGQYWFEDWSFHIHIERPFLEIKDWPNYSSLAWEILRWLLKACPLVSISLSLSRLFWYIKTNMFIDRQDLMESLIFCLVGLSCHSKCAQKLTNSMLYFLPDARPYTGAIDEKIQIYDCQLNTVHSVWLPPPSYRCMGPFWVWFIPS